jgi:DNA-binding transcriptional regulator LsrR (DeoR family)
MAGTGPRPVMGPAELVQAAAMARRFYLEGRSKVQIAEEFGVSRFRVARILDTALERELVKIEIRIPTDLDAERSEAVRARFGLHHAIVVNAPEEQDLADPAGLGAFAARLLAELVTEGDVLGLAWGQAVMATAAAVEALPRCTVVQLTGVYDGGPAGTGTAGVAPGSAGSVEAVLRTARISGGEALPIYAPLVLPDVGTVTTLRSRGSAARAFEEFDRVTVAVMSIGGWDHAVSTVYDSLDEPARRAYADLGVVGEMAAHLFDAQGRRIGLELSARCLAVGAQQLRRVREVVAVAGGMRKRRAIAAVLRSGLVTSLVTDSVVADYLLTEADPGPNPARDRQDPDAPKAP